MPGRWRNLGGIEACSPRPPRTFLNLGSWKCDSSVFHRIVLINKINTQENEVINCLFYPSLVSLVR